MRDLQERLSSIEKNVDEDRVKAAFKVPHINPRLSWDSMPYLKYDLVYEIAIGIRNKEFARTLYSCVNKEPLKKVYYGIRSTRELPEDFLDTLTDWEKIYLFRGRWSERNPNFEDPLNIFTIRHIYLGLNGLNEDHFVRKAKGKYKSQLELPERAEIRRAYQDIILGRNKEEQEEQLSLF